MAVFQFPTRCGHQHRVQSAHEGMMFYCNQCGPREDGKPMVRMKGVERIGKIQKRGSGGGKEGDREKEKKGGREGKEKGRERAKGGTGKEGRGRTQGRGQVGSCPIYQIRTHLHSIGQWSKGQGLWFSLCVFFNCRPTILK